MDDVYNPSIAPVADTWLALPEMDRINLVEAFHQLSGDFGESLRLHASMHVVVENQLALGEPAETGRALSRLLAEGLDRHEAIHAIASVVCEHIFPVLKATAEAPVAFDSKSYINALNNLSEKSWRGES
ncbi:DUF1841 family protein [Pseudomarimonas arenosa]|uniref:DUF1841 family protein n=1 Tax=Pseudomarimonas arenosa TaxID=2774145 RepID=A0AAW3ZNH5_9GAMM|nr:DUF1841 family protein [Pseudomarimonas arenosa]MBD8527518.1 DUF1841 family protein [Pseudomarimonas arenosa]